MSPMDVTKMIFLLPATGLSGVVLGYILRWLITLSQKGSMELTIKQTLLDAKAEAQRRIAEAEKESERLLKEAKEKEREKEQELKKKEEHLIKKDETLDKRQVDIDRELESIKAKVEEVRTIKERGVALEAERAKKLEEIAATVIQHLASSSTPEIMSTAVIIPPDDVKGKIIGKEGRNNRAFERMAGVELIVDDTPGAITISSFDPVRRHIAKAALENLIADGRIQPAKIEELLEKAKNEINKIIKEKGEAAAYETGALNLDPRALM